MNTYTQNPNTYSNDGSDIIGAAIGLGTMLMLVMFFIAIIAITIFHVYSVVKTIKDDNKSMVGWIFTAILSSNLLFVPTLVWFFWAKKEYEKENGNIKDTQLSSNNDWNSAVHNSYPQNYGNSSHQYMNRNSYSQEDNGYYHNPYMNSSNNDRRYENYPEDGGYQNTYQEQDQSLDRNEDGEGNDNPRDYRTSENN